MKRRVLRSAALLVLVAGALLSVLAAGGLLVAASGIIPIKASSGHWAITAWFLHFSMERSVSTQSLWVREPSLDEPWLELKGAGHYETGCRPCHGAPDLRSPDIAMAMTPHPPYLPPLIAEWEPEELFYIVKHGVKFTGMPAWPSQERDDEVRAMVAFLLRLPSLDAEAYRRLVHGEAPPGGSVAPLPDLDDPPEAPRAVLASCARCHGVHGRGREVAAFPKLAGQRRDYFVAAMQAYANDERHSGIMQPIAAGLRTEEIQELADYYSRMPAGASDVGNAPEILSALERGREIAGRGVPTKGVPSCADCHGPGPGPQNSMYPVLAGQFADYLVLQLELFKARKRGGSPYSHLMNHVADRLTAEQMRDVALHYASQPPAHDSSGR